MKRIQFTLLIALLICVNVQAKVLFIGSIAADFGGDDLVVANTKQGDRKIKAGQGLGLKAGLGYSLFPTNTMGLELSSAIGIKFSEIKGSNQEITYNRFPIELMASTLIRPLRLRIGAGIEHYLGAKISSEGELANGSARLSGTGPFLQAGVDINKILNLSVRYTALEIKNQEGVKANANSVGFVMTVRFDTNTFRRATNHRKSSKAEKTARTSLPGTWLSSSK